MTGQAYLTLGRRIMCRKTASRTRRACWWTIRRESSRRTLETFRATTRELTVVSSWACVTLGHSFLCCVPVCIVGVCISALVYLRDKMRKWYDFNARTLHVLSRITLRTYRCSVRTNKATFTTLFTHWTTFRELTVFSGGTHVTFRFSLG